MIEVRGINGEDFLINTSIIEKIEFIPETKVTMTTGRYFLIMDTKNEIVDKIVKYNQKIFKFIATE